MNPLFKGLAKELRKEGLTVQAVSGWKTRGRSGTWNPQGVMFHHTASSRNGGNAPALGIVTHGRTGLPGPLSQFVVGRNGTIYIIAAGRANHAGYGGPTRGIPKDSGNALLIGIECENDGIGEPWSEKQLRAIAILQAVLLKRMKRTPFRLLAHKEWTSRKIDPAGIVMDAWRKRVRKVKKALGQASFRLTATKTVKGKKRRRNIATRMRGNGWNVKWKKVG